LGVDFIAIVSKVVIIKWTINIFLNFGISLTKKESKNFNAFALLKE